jgi:hypothetical protein
VLEAEEGSTRVAPVTSFTIIGSGGVSNLNRLSSPTTILAGAGISLTGSFSLQTGSGTVSQTGSGTVSSAQWFSGGTTPSNTSTVTIGGYGSFIVAGTSLITSPINRSLGVANYDTIVSSNTSPTVYPFMDNGYNVSTVLPNIDLSNHKQLEDAIATIFNIDPMPDFEDGMNNAFSDGIEDIVRLFGDEGVKELRDVFWNTQNLSCIGEALRRFGLIRNETTLDERLQTLVSLLKHRSPVVRDGAMIGLAYLDDLRAIGAIEEAIRLEPVPVLRRDMGAILDQLVHR